MRKISHVLAVPAVGAYYYEDAAALQAKPISPPERYTAAARTAGFRKVREVAEGVSIGIVLADGQVAWGDGISVAYGGTAGRDPVLRSQAGIHSIETVVGPWLKGRRLSSFRQLAREVNELRETVTETRVLPKPRRDKDGLSRRELLTAPLKMIRSVTEEEEAPPTEEVVVERRLHSAVRYGVSQALLRAVALARGVTMAEVIAEEWDLPAPDTPVAIHAQCGSERYHNVDKMIVRRVASLPHSLIDDIPEQLGPNGSKLYQYMRWLVGRIKQLGGEEYRPVIHLDVHGSFGILSDNNLGKVLGQIYTLEHYAEGFDLRIESPVIMESRQDQIEAMKRLKEYIGYRKMRTRLVVDEWANTLEDIQAFLQAGAADMIQVKMPDVGSLSDSIEALLACKAAGVAAFLGGSPTETDLSAQVAVHVALATRPEIIMARPGTGVDEAISITQNEMSRTLARIQSRHVHRHSGTTDESSAVNHARTDLD